MRSLRLVLGAILVFSPLASHASLIGQDVACNVDSPFPDLFECSTTDPQTVGDGAEFQLLWFDQAAWDVDIGAESILLTYLLQSSFQWGGAIDVFLNLFDLSWGEGGGTIVDAITTFSGITLGPDGPPVPDGGLDATFTVDSVTLRFNAGETTNWQVGSSMLVELVTEHTSVPEPTTLALLGIGLLGMGLARRRKV